MIERLTEEYLVQNLAQLARQSHKDGDQEATEIAVGLLQEYYYTNNKAFAPENVKPLSFRDGPVHKAIETLEATENRTPEQNGQLTVLKEAVEIEADLLLNTQLVVVAPDIHHWDFTAVRTPSDMDTPFKFEGPGTRPLIQAWAELRYSGLLSNPADPNKEGFDASFVLNPQRLADRANDVAHATEHTKERLLNSVFVNAAQNLGRRITFGTPEGQFGLSHWVAQADAAKQALTLTPQ